MPPKIAIKRGFPAQKSGHRFYFYGFAVVSPRYQKEVADPPATPF
jgi:hypothetical protein